MKEICTRKSFSKSHIEIKPSPIHRYGVFAVKDIFPNEIIEECPVVTFKESLLEHQDELNRRAFFWDDIDVAIALGCGSIYNHSNAPNAAFFINRNDEIIKFTAIKPIAADTEILIDYANDEKEIFSQEKNKSNNALQKVFLLFLFLLILSMIFPIHLPS